MKVVHDRAEETATRARRQHVVGGRRNINRRSPPAYSGAEETPRRRCGRIFLPRERVGILSHDLEMARRRIAIPQGGIASARFFTMP